MQGGTALIIQRSTNSPPGSPSPGDTYLIGSSPTGAWSGHPFELTTYVGGTWLFLAVPNGWFIWDDFSDKPYVMNGATAEQIARVTDITAANFSGTLDIMKGGTGQTTAQAALDALAGVTTKGDLLVRDASNLLRLAVGGTDRQVLRVKSSAGQGVAWEDPLIMESIGGINSSATAVGATTPIIYGSAPAAASGLYVPAGKSLKVLACNATVKTGATVGSNYDINIVLRDEAGANTVIASSHNNANDTQVLIRAEGTLASPLASVAGGAAKQYRLGIENAAGSTGAHAATAHVAIITFVIV